MYRIGRFDGTSFVPEAGDPRPLDLGPNAPARATTLEDARGNERPQGNLSPDPGDRGRSYVPPVDAVVRRRGPPVDTAVRRRGPLVDAVVRRRGSPVDAVVRRVLRRGAPVDAVVRRRGPPVDAVVRRRGTPVDAVVRRVRATGSALSPY